jgi:hypothetical protein
MNLGNELIEIRQEVSFQESPLIITEIDSLNIAY